MRRVGCIAPSDELRALFAVVFAGYQHDEARAGRKSRFALIVGL